MTYLIGKSVKATGKISNNKAGQGFQISIVDLNVNDKEETVVVAVENESRVASVGKQHQMTPHPSRMPGSNKAVNLIIYSFQKS